MNCRCPHCNYLQAELDKRIVDAFSMPEEQLEKRIILLRNELDAMHALFSKFILELRDAAPFVSLPEVDKLIDLYHAKFRKGTGLTILPEEN